MSSDRGGLKRAEQTDQAEDSGECSLEELERHFDEVDLGDDPLNRSMFIERPAAHPSKRKSQPPTYDPNYNPDPG